MIPQPAILAGLFLCLAVVQSTPAPVVDLEYSQYQGYYDPDFDLNIYKGIRYAAPPVGKLRWQRPETPAENRSEVIQATEDPPKCPQSRNGGSAPPWATTQHGGLSFSECVRPSERRKAARARMDTLIGSIWGEDGGGYGQGSVRDPDLRYQLPANNNSYITVGIQYRLGAFGFLSSGDVAHHGTPNAAIHDMRFALQWVQKYVHLFGGDPSQVTIAGESAGGGAVMLLAMAESDSDKSLFNAVISSSPYLPTQWGYSDTQPSESYYRFAEAVGCLTDEIHANGSVFDCLVSQDSGKLQTASDAVSASGRYGQWAFIPVTDGTLIKERPSVQLLSGEVSGMRVLTSNNLNEAAVFTPQNVKTEEVFKELLLNNYPLLTTENITSILDFYGLPAEATEILADSNGQTPPFSTTNSEWGSGWQQVANNFYAEATFVCPSYWLAEAYTTKAGKGTDKGTAKAWRYQYSVSPASHGNDVAPAFNIPNPATANMPRAFLDGLQHAWGNFIVHGVPSLMPVTNVNEASPMESWPQWAGEEGQDNYMLNFNVTGGVPVATKGQWDGANITTYAYVDGHGTGTPLEAVFEVVEGSSWEGGRGRRCQLLADLGPYMML
ncbi:carboxylesterase [Apiospora rasikravindrae]|uniref:Carboxylic ester hydrolase n=1 Tax=Apiospora rasikravindrae TaxID=990691 RepID=A0ABR1U0B9_9PEZI